MERPKIKWNIRKITGEQKKRMKMIARKEESTAPVTWKVKKEPIKTSSSIGVGVKQQICCRTKQKCFGLELKV